MAIIIAFANHKGGVAKTSSVAALATIFASSGYRTLMVDLDTQANLTYSFINVDENPPARFIYDAIRERRNLPQAAVKENLYLVPSGLEMTLVEEEMHFMKRREYVLQDLVVPVEDKYDIVMIDCPPALNILTQNAFVIADRLTVPINADQMSYNGLKMMKAYVGTLSDLNPGLRIDDVFFTRVNPSTNLTGAWSKAIGEEFREEKMDAFVRQCVKVQEAASYFKSVVDYSPRCNAAEDYRRLAEEYARRLSGTAAED